MAAGRDDAWSADLGRALLDERDEPRAHALAVLHAAYVSCDDGG